jgi:membrane dipeptidase
MPHSIGRRAWLTGAALLAARPARAASLDDARRVLDDAVTIDLHSHAGALIGMWRVNDGAPFAPLAGPMRQGGMAVAVLAIVPDAPCYKVTADIRFEPFHPPDPGELYAYSTRAFARLLGLVRAEGLGVISDAAMLRAARAARPSVIVASEGGDFLEGVLDRVDEAYARYGLRHLQLTHYRVNELGDCQTDPPVHGGLSAFGADVIRRCNRLGIVVDVAHGTFDLVRQAASITRKPLVLSHSSLTAHPGPRQRRITPAHARLVADTGGVIGIWPPISVFADKAAYAAGIAQAVDAVGIDHIGIGTDMEGLIFGTCYHGYEETPAVAAALLDHGFGPEEVRKIMGGNYARVFAATVG